MSLSSFVLRYILEIVLRIFQLGFSVQLFAPYEAHGMLWYQDYLLAWMCHVHTDARQKIVRHVNEPGAGGAVIAGVHARGGTHMRFPPANLVDTAPGAAKKAPAAKKTTDNAKRLQVPI